MTDAQNQVLILHFVSFFIIDYIIIWLHPLYMHIFIKPSKARRMLIQVRFWLKMDVPYDL